MEEQKKIILHILTSNMYSGAENVVCQIITMFKESSYIMLYCSPDGSIRKALEENDIVFCPIKKANVKDLKEAIKKLNPAIIHAHDMRASFLASVACGKIPYVSHIHNNNFDSQKISIKSILYRIAAAKAKHIFWVSESSFNGFKFHRSLAKKSTILQNVININDVIEKAKKSEVNSRYDIVYVGRLTYQKNPERLLDILIEAIKKKNDLQVAIVGSGDKENIVKKIIKEKKMEENIHYLGFISNPYGIMKKASLMVMTSRWEGTPMCALEAMVLGVPMISTPTDGLRDLIVDGETGFLTNNDKVFVEKILQICKDKNLRERLSINAYERAKQINDLNKYKKKIEDVYNFILKDC